MKAKEYLKVKGIPKTFFYQQVTHHDGGFSVETIPVNLDALLEDFAKQEAIEFALWESPLYHNKIVDGRRLRPHRKIMEKSYDIYYNQKFKQK